MIPRHRPPFSFREFLAAQIGYGSPSPQEIEGAVQELLDAPHAILLPSARFGIWAGLKIVAPRDRKVAVPVLNCSAVHEAAIRSELDIEFVDCSEGSFLMNVGRMPASSAWVLSELYGQTYDLPPQSQRPFCIVDMAMTVPETSLVERLGPFDLGLFSFGNGKAFYAGHGGLALSRDGQLAQEIRQLVSHACREDTRYRTTLQKTFNVGARVIAHWRPLYALARKLQTMRLHPIQTDGLQPIPSGWYGNTTQAEEWHRLPARPELKMVTYNFWNWAKQADARRKLESHYRYHLQGLNNVILPAVSKGVLSHFTIRVRADHKDRVRQNLWRHGIDTGIFFGFPRYCDPALFPNAVAASEELINLPVIPGLTEKYVRRLARILAH